MCMWQYVQNSPDLLPNRQNFNTLLHDIDAADKEGITLDFGPEVEIPPFLWVCIAQRRNQLISQYLFTLT